MASENNHGGARPGSGRKHAASRDVEEADRFQAALQFAAGRAVVDRLINDGGPLPAEMMLDAARFHYRRANDIEVPETATPEEREALLNRRGSHLDKAAERSKDAAQFFHPKLQSVAHTGTPPAPVVNNQNVILIGLLDRLAAQAGANGPIIEAVPSGTGETPVRVEVLGSPGAVAARAEFEDYKRRLENLVASLRPRIRENSERGGVGPGTGGSGSPPVDRPDRTD